jgi:hypothetical protein
MADDPAVTPAKPKSKGGRPSRAAASAKALRGIDPAAIDLVMVLRTIAADRSAPASARVNACRTLLALPGDPEARRKAAEAAVLARPTKKALQQRAASEAGTNSDWGSLLHWDH